MASQLDQNPKLRYGATDIRRNRAPQQPSCNITKNIITVAHLTCSLVFHELSQNLQTYSNNAIHLSVHLHDRFFTYILTLSHTYRYTGGLISAGAPQRSKRGELNTFILTLWRRNFLLNLSTPCI